MLPPAPSRVLIGREPGCEVLLDDRECSKQHAEVLRDHEGVTLRDLGSRNGIVMGDRGMPERRLRHGDEFTVGRTALRYHDPTEELLRAMETGADEPVPELPTFEAEPAPVQEPEALPALPAPAATEGDATTSEAPAASSAKPALVSAKPLTRKGTFDWVVVVLAVVILMVSASGLMMLLSGR